MRRGKKTSLALITNVLNTTKENFPLRLTCHTLHLSVLSGDGGGGVSQLQEERYFVLPHPLPAEAVALVHVCRMTKRGREKDEIECK